MSIRSVSKLFFGIATCSAVALASASASAQTAAIDADAPQGAAPSDHGPRARFGVGATSGFVTQSEAYSGGSQTSTALTPIGLALRLGVQLDDHYAVFYQGGSELGIGLAVRNGVLFEVTPRDWFSVGAGLSLNYFLAPNLSGMFGSTRLPDSDTWSVGVPVRLALNLPMHRTESGRRLGSSLDVNLTPAYSFGGYQLPSGFQLGAVAGLSFELY